jgi:hypothetical protein
MRKSLRTQGYYANDSTASQPSPSASSYQDFSRQPEVDFGGVADDDMPETKPMAHLKAASASVSRSVADEAPAPRPKKAAPSAEEAKALAYENCPTAFGDFAGSADCYSVCKANMACKTETDRKASSRALASQQRAKPQFVEDDDIV